MKSFKPSPSVIALINLKIAYSIFLGAVAYFIWPGSIKWYGFAALSILVGMGAIGLMINVIAQIGKIHTFEKQQAAFKAQGNSVKSSSLASHEFLTRKGVIRR